MLFVVVGKEEAEVNKILEGAAPPLLPLISSLLLRKGASLADPAEAA